MSLTAGRARHDALWTSGAINWKSTASPCCELGDILDPASFELLPGMAYDDYMKKMEEGHFCLESYPFGGCNTVIDSLWIKRPTVCLQGTRWYNRIGSYFLKTVGLAELITTPPAEYVELTVRLIQDVGFRAGIQARVEGLDLEPLFSKDSVHDFHAAVDFLIAHHERLGEQGARDPIVVSQALRTRLQHG